MIITVQMRALGEQIMSPFRLFPGGRPKMAPLRTERRQLKFKDIPRTSPLFMQVQLRIDGEEGPIILKDRIEN